MITSKPPYFMKNKDWYYHDPEKMMYVLTNKAPLKAKISYQQFYKELNNETVGEREKSEEREDKQ